MPFLSRLLNLIFPPQCLNCDVLVATHGTLCLDCWNGVRFITEPCCASCGYPFDFAMGAGALCGQCLSEPPNFSRARAAFAYNEASLRLVLKLKFHDQTLLARVYGKWLMSAGGELIAASDIIVPVPLHYWRFVGRRYNQAALLAQALSHNSGKPTLLTVLRRTRRTAPQATLPRKDRLENVKGAFAINPRHAANLKGKTVLLVDDVMTTGTTLKQCTKALLKAGATQVNVLTLARTVL